jgi:hypothetical protein
VCEPEGKNEFCLYACTIARVNCLCYATPNDAPEHISDIVDLQLPARYALTINSCIKIQLGLSCILSRKAPPFDRMGIYMVATSTGLAMHPHESRGHLNIHPCMRHHHPPMMMATAMMMTKMKQCHSCPLHRHRHACLLASLLETWSALVSRM